MTRAFCAAIGSLSGMIFQFCLGIPALFTTQHSGNYVRSKKPKSSKNWKIIRAQPVVGARPLQGKI